MRLIEELLTEISEGRQTIEVSLSAHDLKLIEGNDARFREKYPEIEFRADADLRPGDCIARSRHGTIDGRLATKLKTRGARFPMSALLDLQPVDRPASASQLGAVKLAQRIGRVAQVTGLVIESDGPDVALGDVCRIQSRARRDRRRWRRWSVFAITAFCSCRSAR